MTKKSSPVPAALAPIAPYLERADELSARYPTEAHHLRVYALSRALNITREKAATNYLLTLVDSLEHTKPDCDSVQLYDKVRALALDLSRRATDADTGAFPTPTSRWAVVDAPRVAQAFHASAVLLDSLQEFGPLSDELSAMMRVAHSRSRELALQLSKAMGSSSPLS